MNIEEPGALVSYLRRTGHIEPDESPDIRILNGGVSNRTVLVARANGDRWVLKQALAQLRVAVEWFSPPERISREALGMRWLGRLLPEGAVPRLLFEDPSEFLLSMTAVPEPHRNWKSMLLAGSLDLRHVVQFASLLATIHSARGDDAARAFADKSFFESLRLEPYYSYTAGRVIPAAPFIGQLLDETRSIESALVHGDFSPKNILVHDDRLVLLDHEVIHFGDPAFDIGFSLTHLLSKAHNLSAQREQFTTAAHLHWREYARADPAWAEQLEARAVRHTLACLLARVDGRSPLEYLTAEQRDRQRDAVLRLMNEPPASIAATIDRFIAYLPDLL